MQALACLTEAGGQLALYKGVDVLRLSIDAERSRFDILKNDESSSDDSNSSVGRKLDFIVQEMNREANTTLSKSDTLTVTDIGIDLKTCIEKIREQVQNIE